MVTGSSATGLSWAAACSSVTTASSHTSAAASFTNPRDALCTGRTSRRSGVAPATAAPSTAAAARSSLPSTIFISDSSCLWSSAMSWSHVVAVLDAAVRHAQHVAGDADVDHGGPRIADVLGQRGAQFFGGADRGAAAPERLPHRAEFGGGDHGEVGVEALRFRLVVLRAEGLVVHDDDEHGKSVAAGGFEFRQVHQEAGVALDHERRFAAVRDDGA